MKNELKELSAYWMTRAQDALASAELELNSGFLNGCVNRLYYSLFYAVTSLLALKEVEFGKHAAVRSWLNSELVKTGTLSLDEGKLYNRLFDERHEADYMAFASFDKNELKETAIGVKALLKRFYEIQAFWIR